MQEIKLNRACNMFRPKFWIHPAIVAMCALIIVILATSPTEELILSSVTFVCFVVVVQIFSYPAKMNIAKDEIVYTDKQSVRVYPGKGGTRSVKVTYTVTYLYDIEFRQSRMESIFNVGTLVFNGRTSMQASKYEDMVEFPNIHEISGIKKFSETKSIIEGILQG